VNDDESAPPAPVVDLALFRQKREAATPAKDGQRYKFHFDADTLSISLETPHGVVTWGRGSAETIGTWLVRSVNHVRRKEAQAQRETITVPALRKSINDAVLADRTGGRDAGAEERVQHLRYADYQAWAMLTERERGRWLRLMRKRRKEGNRS